MVFNFFYRCTCPCHNNQLFQLLSATQEDRLMISLGSYIYSEYHGGQFGELWVFGPSYRTKELDFRRDAKKLALHLLLDMSECTRTELLSTLEDIEEEARTTYAENALQNMDRDDFREMMAVDGCFFLLVAFSILGVESLGIELNFSNDHPIFGIGCVRDAMEMWFHSMFFVGNQMPFIVLEQLMKLRFFQELKTKNEWKQPLDLAKRAIYKLLIIDLDQKPVDLLHCLQSLIPGTKSVSHVPIPIMGNIVDGEIDDIPSAKELFELGIEFRPMEEDLQSGGIHYKRGFFKAVLNLPIFKVDRYTVLLMECLFKYEIVQGAKGIVPEASSFLKLLSKLIRTPLDIEVLSSHGVIQDIELLSSYGVIQDIEVLSSHGLIQGRANDLLAFLRDYGGRVSIEHLCHVGRDIKEYPPRLWWKHIRHIRSTGRIYAILVLTLAYYYFLATTGHLWDIFDQ